MVVLLNPSQMLATSNIVTNPFITLTFEGFIYGFYTLLFFICVYILRHPNRPLPHLKLYTPALIPLYALATTSFVLSVANVIITSETYVEVLKGENMAGLMWKGRIMMILSAVTHITFLLANMVSDGVLIYRTYIIWGSRKRFIIAPIIFSVATNVVGVVAISVQLSANLTLFVDGNNIFMWFTGAVAFTQLFLTFMIAGRIWWISRQMARNSSMRKSVRTIIAITLESGIVYAILLVIYQVQNSALPISIDLGLYPILIQFAGLSPTLIIIRAALGMSIENSPDCNVVTSPLSPLDFAQGPSGSTVTAQLTFNSLSRVSAVPQTTNAGKATSLGEV